VPAAEERPDEDLVAAARGGDRDAMDALLRRHYERIHTICRRITADPDEAADCTQEALIAIVRGIKGFDGRAAFTTWCHRVTTNACLDELRRRRRRPVPTDDTDQPVERAGAPSNVPLDDATATRLDVDAALAELPLEFRVAVVLRDLCGLDYEEIGEILAVPPGTVRSRIARGRRTLASLLAPPGNPAALLDVEGGDHG
jgi:RNA polymerase sigma-70 factor (ECF subfamily)